MNINIYSNKTPDASAICLMDNGFAPRERVRLIVILNMLIGSLSLSLSFHILVKQTRSILPILPRHMGSYEKQWMISNKEGAE